METLFFSYLYDVLIFFLGRSIGYKGTALKSQKKNYAIGFNPSWTKFFFRRFPGHNLR